MKEFLLELFFIVGITVSIGLALLSFVYFYMLMIEFLYYDKLSKSKTNDSTQESSLEKLKKEISKEWSEHIKEKQKKVKKMRAIEYLKEKLTKLCMSFNGVWISQEELDEAAKELEKIVKEQNEDRLSELEKAITDYYLAKGYVFDLFGSRLQIYISTFQNQKEIQILIKKDFNSNYETVFRICHNTTKEMFDAAFEHFSVKE